MEDTIKTVELLDKEYATDLIIKLHNLGFRQMHDVSHIDVIKDLRRSIGHNINKLLARHFLEVNENNKTYVTVLKLDKPDDFFTIRDKIITVEKHGKKLKVKSHLNKRHQEHCLCWAGCKYFKPSQIGNCEIAERLLQFDIDNGVTTPVWECVKYE